MRTSWSVGSILPMTSRRLLLALPAAAGLVVLSACGSDDVQGAAEAGASSVSSAASSAGSAASSAASSATSSGSSSGGSSAAAEIDFEDQSGGGDVATVARVSAPEAGFVVVTDDDRSDDGAVLGSTAVDAGTSTDVQVPLDPPLDGDADLEATLFADTDGDGSFDASVDQPVAEPEDSDDGDDTDVVDDGAEYAVN